MREIEEPSDISEGMENFWKRIENGEIQIPSEIEPEEGEEIVLLKWGGYQSGYTPEEERKIQQEAFRESLGAILHESRSNLVVFYSRSKGHYRRWINPTNKSLGQQKIKRYRREEVEVILIKRTEGIVTTWKTIHPELGHGGYDDGERTEQEVLGLIDLQRNNS